ncbi:putative NAD(P)/FAD-binding protein YdhS [Pedobacter sp. UYP30]|uniref:FAD/NAD(P)-binding protein n=1 Tax=Pedobacter sp. UYP30 TaxID=1756400 RepID=UPI00339350DF
MLKNIAIIGGGPSALFMFQRFVQAGNASITIDIFERSHRLGAGMPYSTEGALNEHITNVSGNEIPELVSSVSDWIKTVPKEVLDQFDINLDNFSAYQVLPRLLFGDYLENQFNLLIKKAQKIGIETNVFFNSEVTDIKDFPKEDKVQVDVTGKFKGYYEHVIICTGHTWPKTFEGKVDSYFDSPYPPEKLKGTFNHAIAIKGSSLTAIDAIRTLARQHGKFSANKNNIPKYQLDKDCAEFKMVMHSRHGMLPAVRFHLADPHLLKETVLSRDEVAKNMQENDGFLLLDFVFDKNFKELFKEKDPAFYASVKNLSIEQFVDQAMELRERLDPFQLFEAEYAEADKSIKRRESVYWKELLAVLSFAMNYPAKHFSAEDMIRLQRTLMPLISIVIAFVPQCSVEELLALNKAGVLQMVAVDEAGTETPHPNCGAVYHYKNENNEQVAKHFKTFINCVGQPHLNYKDFPFKSLLLDKTISPAKLKFKNINNADSWPNDDVKVVRKSINGTYLNVPGIAINDNFQALDEFGALNPRVYVMAVPYISGFNPDYSGLDFGEAASKIIARSLCLSDKNIDV